MARILSYLVILSISLISCGDSKHATSPAAPASLDEKAALVILVENNDGLLRENQQLEPYKPLLLPVLSDIFGIPTVDMMGMPINEIIEVYGEEWQINSIAEAGKGYYGRIESLSDGALTYKNFFSLLKGLSAEGFRIDMVFCLHGSRTSFYLAGGPVLVSEFSKSLVQAGIEIRSLYQTCCWGKYTIPDWESSGIEAVNGAQAVNNITMFSPAFFLENRLSGGLPFDEAVQLAKLREIEKLKSLDNPDLPVLQYFLTEESLFGSGQFIGGRNPRIYWGGVSLAL